VPDAATLKLAGWPIDTVRFAGLDVMLGAEFAVY
jgi:hypothetical protein